MRTRTSELWAEQNRHPGDRLRLFSATSEAVTSSTVLYPGPWVDIAPSFVFENVTYVDTDRRAGQFFDDPDGVDEIIAQHRQLDSSAKWRFIHDDYTSNLPLNDGHFDLLVSLYAGFISEHCTRYLRPGGHLLVNSSHGDAAMASINPAFRLIGVVKNRSGRYSVTDKDLDSYMVPKKPAKITAESLHKSGRGVAYTKPAFAYVFEHLGL